MAERDGACERPDNCARRQSGEAYASDPDPWGWTDDDSDDPCADLQPIGTCTVDGVVGPCIAPEGANGVEINGGGKVMIGSEGPDIFISTYASTYGSNFASTICGLGGDDIIYAYGGDDTIYAGAGDDYVKGGRGADKIFGGSGDDVLFGARGNDKINGGSGHDVIYGGKNSGEEYLYGGDSGDDFIDCEANDGPCHIVGGWSGHSVCVNATEIIWCSSEGTNGSFSDGFCSFNPEETECDDVCDPIDDLEFSPDCGDEYDDRYGDGYGDEGSENGGVECPAACLDFSDSSTLPDGCDACYYYGKGSGGSGGYGD